MNYCVECGTKLEMRECSGEGMVPFCSKCDTFRFPIFNVAISTEILNQERNKILLIQQYGKKRYVLVAGFINKGENAEHTLVREVMEELGLQVVAYKYMKSEYFAPTNTLMINFASIVNSEDLSGMTKEVDMANWFSFAEAKEKIMEGTLEEGSLAARFLLHFLAHYSPDERFNTVTAAELGDLSKE